jgi:hypothetical protein
VPFACFDDYSWKTFVALNWPSVAGRRNVPDISRGIEDFSVQRVWETWKAAYELFQSREEPPPSEWSSFDAATPCPNFSDNHRKVLAEFSKFGGFNQAGVTATLPDGPLVAQNHTYARYEIRINEPEFNLIRENKWYLTESLPTRENPAKFPNPSTGDHSIEVKAVWREFKPNESSEKERFYIVEAMVWDPITNTCEPKSMALVGMHIVQKTSTRPQWIWSTFEQVDNVLESGSAPAGQLSFNSGNPEAQRLDPPLSPLALSPNNPPTSDPTPMQVVRLVPVAASTELTNRAYQKALAGTVWANYKLVMTQWPTKVIPETVDNVGSPFPAAAGKGLATANTVAETYFQTTITCMECHQGANSLGSDFVFFISLRSFRRQAVASTSSAAGTVLRKNGPEAAIQWLRALTVNTGQ